MTGTWHLSFDTYYDPLYLSFGAVNILNDETLISNSGFDSHVHANEEILTLVIEGCLTHTDSLGNFVELQPGMVQLISAGTGISHREWNCSPGSTRFVQIRLFPRWKNSKPHCTVGSYLGRDAFEVLASGEPSSGGLPIGQDVTVSLCSSRQIETRATHTAGLYAYALSGTAQVGEYHLQAGDAVDAIEEPDLMIQSQGQLLIIQTESPSGWPQLAEAGASRPRSS